jgi:hypothetical protein
VSSDGYIEVPHPFELKTDPEALAAEDALYRELAAHSQLAGAVQAAAAELAIDLGTVAPGIRPRYDAWVDSSMPDRKPMEISIGADERRFRISGWSRGVQLVSGATADLREVLRAAAAWRRGASLDEIQQAAPSVEVSDLARAHERGPADAVAEQWRELRARWDRRRIRFVVDIIDAAYAVPQLRQLFPYSSHFDLCFSTWTGVPYSRDIPRIYPRGDVYFLHECDGYVLRYGIEGDVIGEADDAESAITALLAQLPANVGPARAGTAADP